MMDKDKIETIDAMAGALMSALDLECLTIVAIDSNGGGHNVGAFVPTNVNARRTLALQLRACADRVDPEPYNWIVKIEAPEQ